MTLMLFFESLTTALYASIMLTNPAASQRPTILYLPRELRDIIIEYCFLERDPVSVELPNYPSPPPVERLYGNKYASHEQLAQHYRKY